jgi:hypothetical protein
MKTVYNLIWYIAYYVIVVFLRCCLLSEDDYLLTEPCKGIYMYTYKYI